MTRLCLNKAPSSSEYDPRGHGFHLNSISEKHAIVLLLIIGTSKTKKSPQRILRVDLERLFAFRKAINTKDHPRGQITQFIFGLQAVSRLSYRSLTFKETTSGFAACDCILRIYSLNGEFMNWISLRFKELVRPPSLYALPQRVQSAFAQRVFYQIRMTFLEGLLVNQFKTLDFQR